MSSSKYNFLKPGEASFLSDRSDVDPTSGSAFTYNPNVHHPMTRQRQKLPVFAVKNHILYLLEKHQTLVVVGETGSGKSTQIPQYLVESGWNVDGLVGITQPRRIACTSLAARVAEERDCLIGNEVGYTIRFDDATTPGTTKIKYMTEAILVREMMGDPLLRQYCAIMLDEVHERTLYTDILLGLLKKIMKRRKDLRIIVCSATIDADEMFQFFNFNKTENKEKDTAAILHIDGRTYPVDIHYLKEPCPDYVSAAAATAATIHLTEPPGDVLVFLTSVEEITRCVALARQHIDGQTGRGSVSSASVLPMHGSLPPAEQLKAFQFAGPTVRKVVVATNVAETSVTIPGIVYVVDCGFVKLRVYGSSAEGNSGALTEGLVVVTESRASAVQRAGRAGRTRPGKVYRLYPEDQYSTLPTCTPPEMTRTNLSPAVLNLLALGIDNMLRFDFPSPPPSRHLISALEELHALGAVGDHVRLTEPLGQRMAEMPLPPPLARMVLMAGEFDCTSEIASIVSLLQVQGVFVTPSGSTHVARARHAKFQVEEGDLLTLLNVFMAWKRQDRSKRWCSRNYVSHAALCRAEEIRGRLKGMMTKWEMEVEDTHSGSFGPTLSTTIRQCITAGLFLNAVYLHHSGEYRSVRTGVSLAIHPSSVLYTQKQPEWLVYHEVLHTNRAYMRDLTVIEERWLTELAPHVYKKARVYDEN